MRLVIDLQGAQSGSRQRGIGRYSLSLAQAIARNAREHEIYVALSGLFPETIEPIRAAFDGLLPQENIRLWHAQGPVHGMQVENRWRARTAELIREAFLASLIPDVVLITSLFEGFGDQAITSIGTLSDTVPTAVILYDLIPLINRDHYLKKEQHIEAWYETKLGHIRRASLLLAISESSRQEGLRFLGFQNNAIVNISGGIDPQFRPLAIERELETAIRSRYSLKRNFIMYTGGFESRKNVEGLIRAYGELPNTLREQHQLAMVGAATPSELRALRSLIKAQSISPDDVVFTGFVPDDDLITLYNLCRVFVFPSWHEGLGLPALEAMGCGRAVIAANSSSLPEVIGRDDALFNPRCASSISEKLTKVLTNDVFREQLEKHGLDQSRKFSWDESARRAIAALETWKEKSEPQYAPRPSHARRPRLAYLSPLPPERSGISDYSAELLPELHRHYDIDVIVVQDTVNDPWIRANCAVQSVEDFKSNFARYDRVLYHVGNSEFHQHMFSLITDFPGVVVLHDFFLSNILAHRDLTGDSPNLWASELYRSHGYAALAERFQVPDAQNVICKYPANFVVLRDALGVIFHSNHSRRLARQWYGPQLAINSAFVPLARAPAPHVERDAARLALGFDASDFVVCSFGFIDETKLNHRLLDAWLASSLASNRSCHLVFVGDNPASDYGRALISKIEKSGIGRQIRITGWADTPVFRQFLEAADVAVQLRAQSRGETSAAVLDCMNYGLATIVNAHGSMAELPEDGTWKLPDTFVDTQLIEALEELWRDPARRRGTGDRARQIIEKRHRPRACADQYAEAIEGFYADGVTSPQSLVEAIARIENPQQEAADLPLVASMIARNFPYKQTARQLFLDVSSTCRNDLKTGIERVVRAFVQELIKNPPEGFRVEPVYLSDEGGRWHYRYARKYTLGLLGCAPDILEDDIAELQVKDLVLGLDLSGATVQAVSYLDDLYRCGIEIYFLVYDLLPITMPIVFPPGAADQHEKWVGTVTRYNGAVCISSATAQELKQWIAADGATHCRPFSIGWVHLGADLLSSFPSHGQPDDSGQVLSQMAASPSFLMVGTVEPRKGHSQTLAAFEMLWAKGLDVNLIIVGKEGWSDLPVEHRRSIPKITAHLRASPELGKRLIWLEGVSDEYLARIYTSSTALIAASEGEGFGLPLIEAAQYKLPIIARDLEVFREVAGEHAFYFSGKEPADLASAIEDWLARYEKILHPKSDDMRWSTWEESASRLKQVIIGGDRSDLSSA